MDTGDLGTIVALLFLVICSAFFSASETAYTSLNTVRMKHMAAEGDARAAKVLKLAERYESLLSSILVGNNIVNIAASSIATVLATAIVGPENGALVSTVVLTLVLLIFGEVMPKSIAKDCA